MPNLFWYILVSIVGLGISIFTIYMKRDIYQISTFIVFFLFTSGVSWIGEFTVLGFFDSYAYKTGVFTSPWAQNILGHKLLNTSLYPAVAIVTAVYSLRYYWMSVISASFILIEYLFIKLGAYEQHWWRYYMTGIVAFVFLWLTKYWFSKMIQKTLWNNKSFYIFLCCDGHHGLFSFYFIAYRKTKLPNRLDL